MSARRAYSKPALSRTAPRQGDPRIYSVSEIVFELWVERVQHTRWEHPLTPEMRPVRRAWRPPAG